MIRFLKGVLAEKTLSTAIIDINGIGYEVTISATTYKDLPSLGKHVKLHTFFYVREDRQELYGFITSDELNLFERLLEVQNVGTKISMSILSATHPLMFKKAILENNISFLSTIPGIGKKTAEKLILELKNKIKDWVVAGDTQEITTKSQNIVDAIAGLVSLGYREPEAKLVVEDIVTQSKTELTAEELITQSLRKLGK